MVIEEVKLQKGFDKLYIMFQALYSEFKFSPVHAKLLIVFYNILDNNRVLFKKNTYGDIAELIDTTAQNVSTSIYTLSNKKGVLKKIVSSIYEFELQFDIIEEEYLDYDILKIKRYDNDSEISVTLNKFKNVRGKEL